MENIMFPISTFPDIPEKHFQIEIGGFKKQVSIFPNKCIKNTQKNCLAQVISSSCDFTRDPPKILPALENYWRYGNTGGTRQKATTLMTGSTEQAMYFNISRGIRKYSLGQISSKRIFYAQRQTPQAREKITPVANTSSGKC